MRGAAASGNKNRLRFTTFSSNITPRAVCLRSHRWTRIVERFVAHLWWKKNTLGNIVNHPPQKEGGGYYYLKRPFKPPPRFK